MSIFKRQEQGDGKQATATLAPETRPQGSVVEQKPRPTAPVGAQPTPPQGAAVPGVVPPAAAPVYSMRPSESSVRVELDAQSTAPDKARMASDAAQQQRAQEMVQKRVRVAVEAARTTPSNATSLRRRPAPLPATVTTRSATVQIRHSFDPVRAAQTGLLNLAWSWHQAGAPIRAIHAYMEVVVRYPDTEAAAAAVADLVQISDKLAQAGQFHIALGIYEELERLL